MVFEKKSKKSIILEKSKTSFCSWKIILQNYFPMKIKKVLLFGGFSKKRSFGFCYTTSNIFWYFNKPMNRDSGRWRSLHAHSPGDASVSTSCCSLRNAPGSGNKPMNRDSGRRRSLHAHSPEDASVSMSCCSLRNAPGVSLWPPDLITSLFEFERNWVTLEPCQRAVTNTIFNG